MQHEHHSALPLSSSPVTPKKSTIAAKDMFRTFITCESCCFCCWWWCYWTIWTNGRKKAKKTKSPQNKTMKERDKVHIGVIMRFSDFICLSVVRTFVRWWLYVEVFFVSCAVYPMVFSHTQQREKNQHLIPFLCHFYFRLHFSSFISLSWWLIDIWAAERKDTQLNTI